MPYAGDGAILARPTTRRSTRSPRRRGSGAPLMFVELRHLGGALGRKPAGAGALGHARGRVPRLRRRPASWRRRWRRPSQAGARRPLAALAPWRPAGSTSTSSSSRPTRRRFYGEAELRPPACDPRRRRPRRGDGGEPRHLSASSGASTWPARRRASSQHAAHDRRCETCAPPRARGRASGRRPRPCGPGRPRRSPRPPAPGVPSIRRVSRFSASSRCGKPSVGMKPGSTMPTCTPLEVLLGVERVAPDGERRLGGAVGAGTRAADPSGGARDVDDRARRGARRSGSSASVRRSWASKFSAIVRRASSAPVSANEPRPPAPALLTSRSSRPPWCSSRYARACAGASSSSRSSGSAGGRRRAARPREPRAARRGGRRARARGRAPGRAGVRPPRPGRWRLR